jgi:hypothetical protein
MLSLGRGPRTSGAVSGVLKTCWIEEGLMWKVGNGRNIRIWADKRVHSHHTHKIQAPVRILNAEATVRPRLVHGLDP